MEKGQKTTQSSGTEDQVMSVRGCDDSSNEAPLHLSALLKPDSSGFLPRKKKERKNMCNYCPFSTRHI